MHVTATAQAPIARVLEQLATEAPIVDKFLGFEFHAFLSPLQTRWGTPNPLYEGYKAYLAGGDRSLLA